MILQNQVFQVVETGAEYEKGSVNHRDLHRLSVDVGAPGRTTERALTSLGWFSSLGGGSADGYGWQDSVGLGFAVYNEGRSDCEPSVVPGDRDRGHAAWVIGALGRLVGRRLCYSRMGKVTLRISPHAPRFAPAGCGLWARRGSAVKLLLSLMVLSAVVGCPDSDEGVIRDFPPPPRPHSGWQKPPAQPPKAPEAPRSTKLSGKKIMIDPGHGGKDPGAGQHTKSRLPEKTIVLDIGNSVSRILQNRGAKVYATRTNDVYPSLDQRANAAERYKVDVFVSIHADSAPKNPAAAGTEVHIYTSASGQSLSAARCMIAALKKAGLECRGLQRSNLHVLREHSRPAMLVECGFLTNTGDASKLNTPAYRARVAAAIADGITDYLNK